MNAIVNGTPLVQFRKTDDQSTTQPVIDPIPIPTHLPKIYIFASEGPEGGQLAVGAARNQMYGSKSFDLRQPWATHATVLANAVNAAGNAAMYERVFPADIGPKANVRIGLDVLVTRVPLYERNEDGSIKRDTAGQPVPTGEYVTQGNQVKWVKQHIELGQDGESLFGLGTQGPGDQVDTTTSTQSVFYPIMDLEIANKGKYGEDIAYRMYAPTQLSSTPVNTNLLTKNKVYPFRVACVRRATADSTPSIVETETGAQYVDVSWQPGVIDLDTDLQYYLGDQFIPSYENFDNTNGMPPKWGPFGRLHLYQANIDLLTKRFYDAEVPYIDGFSDFTGDADEQNRFNFIGGVSSQNVPYHSFVMVTSAENSLRMTENSHVFAMGGSDGTMNETTFAKAVALAVAEYGNENSPLQDLARYPESIIYDSGFPLETKYALTNFIAIRPDTYVVLATHDVLGKSLTAAEESALGVALRTRLQMFPESDYYGTPTMRGTVVGRSGRYIGSQYTKRLPLSIEVAEKAAAYMGASNRVWNSDYRFDANPGNMVNKFKDVNITFTPVKVRNKDWENGMIWVEHYDMRSLYFPAFKTVYPNDTSVLTSFFTVMAIVELEKVGARAHRQFTGSSNLTDAQLVERVNRFVEEDVAGRFDDRFVIRSNCQITSQDQQRGYSWTLEIVIYAPNMRTVQTLYITARRRSDLELTA